MAYQTLAFRLLTRWNSVVLEIAGNHYQEGGVYPIPAIEDQKKHIYMKAS